MRDLITRRLRDTQPPADPVKAALAKLPPDIAQAWFNSPLLSAAVLIPLIPRPDGMTMLLTRRAEHVKHHAGQISFPGGRTKTSDDGPRDTALRETAEEIGVPPAQVTVIGYLEAYPVVTGYAVVPVVGIVDGDPPLRLDSSEVAEAFEVPLAFLRDENNVRPASRVYKGIEVETYEYLYGGHRIWGATADMIKNFNEKAFKTNI